MEKWKIHYYFGLFFIFTGATFFVFLFVVLPFLNPTYKYVYIFGSFIGIPPLIFGIIEVRHAFKYRKDKFFFPFGILIITESNIKTFLQEKVIEGDGSQDNPFQILDYSKLPSAIILTKIESFLQINNAELNILELKKCRNIMITNCKIKRIELIYCRDVIIENNVIQVFKIENSWKNLIKNNKISVKYLKYLNKNKASKFPVDELTYFIVFIIATIFLGYMSITSHFFFPFTIMFILSIGGWSMMFFSFIMKLKYYFYPKKSPNIKSENMVIEPLNR